MTLLQKIIKRFFDIILIVILAPLLLPICFILALFIKISDIKAPVLFSQARVGKEGKVFKMYKFRSMVAGDHTLNTPRNEDGSLKIHIDDKITRTGRFMRRFSLDELPQIINVLMGGMSIVGPRPDLPFQVEEYDKATYQRLSVRPGITGWAQVHGRNEINYHERHRLDIDYVNKYSLILDLKIILSTLLIILTGEGLYQKKKSLAQHSNINSS